MDNIPESWRGAIIENWDDLISRHGLLWDFSFEARRESGDILLKATRKIRSGDNVKFETIHAVDCDNIDEVFKKIASLEKQVHSSNAATA